MLKYHRPRRLGNCFHVDPKMHNLVQISFKPINSFINERIIKNLSQLKVKCLQYNLLFNDFA